MVFIDVQELKKPFVMAAVLALTISLMTAVVSQERLEPVSFSKLAAFVCVMALVFYFGSHLLSTYIKEHS